MHKLNYIILVLLMASCVSAKVVVFVDVNETDGLIEIKYDTTEPVRAFALDISVDAGAIRDITGFIRGESTVEKPGYGIFPASFSHTITVDPETGEVSEWNMEQYTPLASPNHPGTLNTTHDIQTLRAQGSKGITIEMGALYALPEAAPLSSGTLCKLAVSDVANMTIVLNKIRGGIVMNDATVAMAPELIGDVVGPPK